MGTHTTPLPIEKNLILTGFINEVLETKDTKKKLEKPYSFSFVLHFVLPFPATLSYVLALLLHCSNCCFQTTDPLYKFSSFDCQSHSVRKTAGPTSTFYFFGRFQNSQVTHLSSATTTLRSGVGASFILRSPTAMIQISRELIYIYIST